MSRYLTPLPGMFAELVESVINKALDRDPDSARRLETIGQRRLRFELSGLGLELNFQVRDERLRVRAEDDAEPDTVVSGSPSALLAMAVPDWRTPGSGVSMSGDADLARAFEQIFRHLNPDWEAVLVDRFGEVLGHQFYRFFAEAGQTGRQVMKTGEEQIGEYLREESAWAVGRRDFESFSREVDELREAIDRLESRLARQGRI